jgi:hypothetical protein
MFDEEESKSPLNSQQWYEAKNASNAAHQKSMEDNNNNNHMYEEEDEKWDPLKRKGYLHENWEPQIDTTDPKDIMEQIHRTALLQKINTVRQAIIASPLDISPNGLSPNLCLQSLAGLREQLEEGAQPRKRTLLILNKWWREFKDVA